MVKSKQPSSAPRTTTITPTSLASTITAFSPSPSASAGPAFYGHLHRAPDAHTLRVYEVSSGKCISRWSSAGSEDEEREQVGAIEWVGLPTKETQSDEVEEGDSSKRGKKRRKSDTAVEAIATPKSVESNKLVLCLGLVSGKIILWSPNGSSAEPTILSHASCTSPITALAFPEVPAGAISARHLWSSHEDGFVRVWDLATSHLVAQALIGEAGKPLDSIAVRYLATSSDKQHIHLLAARLSVSVYSISLSPSKKDKVKELKPTEIGRATGHVEKAFVRWVASPADDSAVAADEEPSRFLSFSPSDRFVQLWQFTPSATRSDAALLARLAVDSGVAAVALSASSPTLAALDLSGSLSVATVPASFDSAASSSKKGRKSSGIATLEATTELVGRAGEGAGIAQVALAGSLVVVCRGGVKPVFESVAVEVDGQPVPRIELDKVGSALSHGVVDETAGAPAPTRYVEPAGAAQRTGDAVAELGSDEDLANDGELDVDLAEPTLAERLKSLNVAKKAQADRGEASDEDDSADDDSDDDDEDEEDEDDEVDAVGGGAIPATTLTTTLLQSLHSSDAPLLESCLAHTNPTLIRATVKRLPSGGLVLALLEALVERLGRAKGGKQGTASVRRSRGLVEWVRQVLVVHVGFLVTIPSLVTRLSALHASLTSRLALQPTLLALDGRLQLVMSQMELRRERTLARAPAVAAGKSRQIGGRYVEGESDEEGSDGEGSDGSIEDIVLGSGSEGEGSEDEGFDSDEELSGEEANGRGVADLLDLEASEDEGSEDEDEEDEEESE